MGSSDADVSATVRLTLLVAGLAVAVGLLNLGTPLGERLSLPLPFSWPYQTATSVTGAFSGFLLIACTLAMKRRFRLGWLATVLTLLGIATQALLQVTVPSLVLAALALAALRRVVANRRRFRRPVEVSSTQRIAAAVLLGSQLYITVGAYSLRAQFDGVESLVDAFYFAVVTSATVGYGDVTPATPFAQLFAVSAILVGTGSFAAALGAVLQPAARSFIRRSLGRMQETALESLEDHVVVLGYGELTASILQAFPDRSGVVVVTADEPVGQRLHERGIPVYLADPADEDSLRTVRLDAARAVIVATDDDADDALTILTVKQLTPETRVVAAANHTENVAKMKRAGADVVISPTTIGGQLLTWSALGEVDAESLERRLLGGEFD